ncbi:MAG: lysophospholipid acyltransferase family protein [Actinomycetota bacterium]
MQATLLPALGAWFRWTIEGSNNLPSEGPAIVASNHIAYLDPLAVGYAVNRAGRRPRFLTKSELFEDRRIGWVLRATRQIEVRRGTAQAASALDDALRALDRGELVVIFPEGTVTTDPDLRPMAARSGAVRLALRSSAPVVPCAVWGTANVWPKGAYAKRWAPRQDIAVRFGEPIAIEGSVDSPAHWRRGAAQLMDEIAMLVASLKPVVPDGRRPLSRST